MFGSVGRGMPRPDTVFVSASFSRTLASRTAYAQTLFLKQDEAEPRPYDKDIFCCRDRACPVPAAHYLSL